MLELLLRIPNQSLRSLQCEPSDKYNSNIALRGFSGKVSYYSSKEIDPQQNFWDNFTSGKIQETSSQKMLLLIRRWLKMRLKAFRIIS